MTKALTTAEFLDLSAKVPLLDVRSPAEFANAHIPGAISFPLFTDSERAAVGTRFKQSGKRQAILMGLDFVGPHLTGFVRDAMDLAPSSEVCLHCWRGGMRSSSMAWLLDTVGFTTYILHGGYKSYRKYAHELFSKSWSMIVLGGYTGSAKTEILAVLRSEGEQVIDLECLAAHLGSAFGSLGSLQQPSQEMFENLLAADLARLDPAKPVWIEDESLNIGKLQIPMNFWHKMQHAPLMRLNLPAQERLAFIMERYGSLDAEFLSACTFKLRKRLGPEKTKICLDYISRGEIMPAAAILLEYYDKCYSNCVARRMPETVIKLDFPGLDLKHIAQELQEEAAKANFYLYEQYHH